MPFEEYYRYFRQWMEPEHETARRRFESTLLFFKNQKVSASSVLDLCAGTGIAGAAAAKAFSASKLTLVDVRKEDLEKVREWLGIAEVNPELRLVAGDVLQLPELVEEHDLAVLWGHTMPHFNPFDAVRLFSGVASVLDEGGYFFIEEPDRIGRFLYNRMYRDFTVERTGAETIVSIHEGYDVRRGVERRGYYILPGFKKMAEMELRAWDLASLLAIGRIFFRDANLITPSEHGVSGVSEVLVFRRPNRRIAGEVYSEFQSFTRV